MAQNIELMNKVNTILLLHAELLTNWERDYLSNLNQTLMNHGQLSEKQLKLLNQILSRRKIANV